MGDGVLFTLSLQNLEESLDMPVFRASAEITIPSFSFYLYILSSLRTELKNFSGLSLSPLSLFLMLSRNNALSPLSINQNWLK
jgi:hypothetical protein